MEATSSTRRWVRIRARAWSEGGNEGWRRAQRKRERAAWGRWGKALEGEGEGGGGGRRGGGRRWSGGPGPQRGGSRRAWRRRPRGRWTGRSPQEDVGVGAAGGGGGTGGRRRWVIGLFGFVEIQDFFGPFSAIAGGRTGIGGR
ncbi:uncharacterized protein A4U43_C08F23080 [Asparagus officinalis]|nr:uncharacterized protein A4U43_C08F23080 [Asparagus officinalis]